MTSIKMQSALNADKEGRRLRALRECFHRALKLALDCPTWEVGILTQVAELMVIGTLIIVELQEFTVCFKGLPEHYTVALYDLYQQVSTARPVLLCMHSTVT